LFLGLHSSSLHYVWVRIPNITEPGGGSMETLWLNREEL
jgi:hypothetical protein